MRTGGGRREILAEINITPLTDIFLVLLIIMMVVAPMLDTRGLKVAVPSIGPSSETKTEPKLIKVGIDAKGAYTIDGTAINRMQLSSKMREMKDEKTDGVLITTNPDATHGALTFAMDAAQTAGITKMAVSADASIK
jgi:biopolymer transport protein ExbD